MGFYSRHIAPRLIAASCGAGILGQQRARIVPEAEGTVLEIGVGSALNLPFYDPSRVRRLWALEPDPVMRKLAARRLAGAPFPVEWLGLEAERIPLDDGSVDTVVFTYTLCSVADPDQALAGIRRVLRPGGRVLFLEHGAAPDPGVRKWQDRLDPLWGRLDGGCHLARRPDQQLEGAGFALDRLETYYLPGVPRFGGYTYLGAARAR